jgi:hypothetical protein
MESSMSLPDHTTPASSGRALVNRYLDAFYLGNFDSVRPVLADEFSFRGPLIEVTGLDAFLTTADGLRRLCKGHRLLRQWEEGREVSSIYEVRIETPVGAGVVTMSEWHVARAGQLVSGIVLFDTAAFRALVPTT